MWLTNTPGIKRFAAGLPLILVVALAMRLAFAWDYQAHAPHRALGAIPFLFESGDIAYSLAQGHGFGSPFRVDTGPTAWMTPLYPMLLAGIMRVLGIYTYQSWVAAVLMNIFFSTLACIPVYYAGKRVGGAGLGAGAAWLWAIFPNAILLSFQSLWDQSLTALLVATIIWATFKLTDKTNATKRARNWIAYGLLWGVTLMANASVLSLLPLLLGWAAYRNRATLRNTTFALGMVVLCCIPWTIRNYVVMHSLVPLRSILGLQLWVGNNPDAKVIWLGDHHPIHDSAERERYIRMGEIAYTSEKGKNAIHYMLTHPRHEAQLISGRFVTFWAGGATNPIGDFMQNHSAWFRYVLVFNLCAAFGALFGIVILFRKHSIYAFPLAVGPVIYPFAYYLTLSEPRYRHPIDPILMLLMAIALAESARFAKRTR